MTTYPIISEVTGNPYIDLVHEYEMQIEALFEQVAAVDDQETLLRLYARINTLDDFVGRLCD